jgi:hypothetical protein
LQEILDEKIVAAPDDWDRLFNVDFYIEINGQYIGIQVKPVSDVSHIPQMYKENQYSMTHTRSLKKGLVGPFFISTQRKTAKRR